MPEEDVSSDEFVAEMGDFEIKKTNVFDRTWKIGPGGSIMTRPLVVGDIIYFGSYNHNLYAVSAADGGLLWKFQAQGPVGASAPVFSDGKVFFGSWDFNVYALDAITGKLVWKHKTEGEIYRSVCVHLDSVYAGSKDGFVYCMDKETGALKWKFRTHDLINCTIGACDGRIFFGSYDQNFYCLSTRGKELWKIATQAEVNSLNQPLVENGRVYFPSFDNNLYCADVETGKVIWKLGIGNYGNSFSPVCGGDMLYHATREGVLHAVTKDGRIAWTFKSQADEIMGLPLVSGKRIFAGAGDQNMYCLDLQGKVLWKFQTQGRVWWQPSLWRDNVLFSSWDCNLYSAKKSNGKLVWKFTASGGPCYIPPPYEIFEVEFSIPESEMDEERKHAYDLDLSGEEDREGAYKSRVTYQTSTRYREKGKYQVDSREEEF
jgi:outer membrane protein assembly factor BamB